MNLIRKLNNSGLTASILFILLLVGFVSTSFLISTPYIYIPLSILAVGGISVLVYVITAIFDWIDEKNKTHLWSIVSIITRSIVLFGALFAIAFIPISKDIKIASIIVFAVTYGIGTILFVLLHIFRK